MAASAIRSNILLGVQESTQEETTKVMVARVDCLNLARNVTVNIAYARSHAVPLASIWHGTVTLLICCP